MRCWCADTDGPWLSGGKAFANTMKMHAVLGPKGLIVEHISHRFSGYYAFTKFNGILYQYLEFFCSRTTS